MYNEAMNGTVTYGQGVSAAAQVFPVAVSPALSVIIILSLI